MKRIALLVVVVLLYLPLQSLAKWSELYTKEKKIAKSFPASGNILHVENKYGDVIINTWDRNEISVEVVVVVKRRSEAKAQDLIDDINIEVEQKKGGVYFETRLERRSITNANGEKMQIDYTVYLPKRNAIAITNRFGNVRMKDYEGDMTMVVEYGDLVMGNITGSEKNIKVNFGKLNIESIAVGRLDIGYSPVVIDRAQRLGIKNQFGKTSINTVQQLNIIQEYASVDIGSVNMISGKVSFANLYIDRVNKSADMKISYAGKADFGNIGDEVSLLKVKSSFSNLYFRFGKSSNLDAVIKVAFGSLKNNNPGTNREIHRIDDNEHHQTSKVYSGKLGNGSGTIELSAEYGNICLD
jgi:hypothetical protein